MALRKISLAEFKQRIIESFMAKQEDYWCECQMYATDHGREMLACCAHLAEARVFDCRYKMDAVFYNPNSKFNQGLSIPHDEDFEPVKGKVKKLTDLAIKAGRVIRRKFMLKKMSQVKVMG